MITRDTLLRQIQQLVQALARALFQKQVHAYDEALDVLDEALRGENVGDLLEMDRASVLALCRHAGVWQPEKALALADVVWERGQLVRLRHGEAGQPEARRWFQHAHSLYAEAIKHPEAVLPLDIHERMEVLREALVVEVKVLAEIDWEAWRPVDPATLVFVVENDRILLIRKKRGLGAGKINGPGGRLEAGEAPLAAAIREVEEELLVTPTDLVRAGELRFQFVDGYAIQVHVYRAGGIVGEPRETDEAIPLWSRLDAIPYEEMWEDDRIWLPHLLAGRPFLGRFLFDGDRMLDHDVAL